jgi:putative Ca2+/H+ antiporter (TMEM165/GDT1 family)
MKAYILIFFSVFLAEIGDKTQLATVLFATDAALSRWGVLLAAAGALVAATIVAVSAGSLLGAVVQPRHLRLAAAVGFIAIGGWMLVRG